MARKNQRYGNLFKESPSSTCCLFASDISQGDAESFASLLQETFLVLFHFQFVRRCSGESVVFVVDKNFNNGIEVAETVSSIQDYIENFTTNFTHAAIITFGGHQLVNKTHRLLTTTESGRVRLFEMLRRVRSARETDSSNAQSALKKAIRLAKSVSTSERSVIFLSASDNGRLASGLSCEKLQVHRRHDKLVPVHVFAFSSSAERFERCAQNSNGHYYRVQNQVGTDSAMLKCYQR